LSDSLLKNVEAVSTARKCHTIGLPNSDMHFVSKYYILLNSLIGIY